MANQLTEIAHLQSTIDALQTAGLIIQREHTGGRRNLEFGAAFKGLGMFYKTEAGIARHYKTLFTLTIKYDKVKNTIEWNYDQPGGEEISRKVNKHYSLTKILSV